MRITTLNIRHGGGTRIPALVAYLLSLQADTLIITEFRNNNNAPLLRQSLEDGGFLWQQSSCSDSNQNGILVASRVPFEVRINNPSLGENQHRLLQVNQNGLDLIGCYFPQGKAKQPVFDFIHQHLTQQVAPFGLILGDVNTGSHYVDEVGKTFHCAASFCSLLEVGWVDLWRSRNSDSREYSWFSSAGNGFRIDHALATKKLNEKVLGVAYDHTPRLSKMTDHSALVVDLV